MNNSTASFSLGRTGTGVSKLAKLPLLFSAKIVLFAFIYWLAFSIRPDAFNFAAGYNAHPLTAFLQNFYRTDDPEIYTQSKKYEVLGDFERKSLELRGLFAVMLSEEAEAKKAEQAYEAHVQKQIAVIEKGISEYEAANIEPLNKQIELFDKEIENAEADPVKRLAYTKQTIEATKKLSAHLDYIIYNRLAFLPAELIEREEELAAMRSKKSQEAFDAQLQFRGKRADLHDVFIETRKSIISNISFLDFLYFSACISTTTTFGDITANKGWLRMIVVFQILSGIVIVSLMLGSLLDHKNNS